MNLEYIEMEERGRTAIVRFSRPDKFNAIDLDVARDLLKALDHVSELEPTSIILTGAGQAFSAGGDVKAMASADDPEKFLYRLVGDIHKVVNRMMSMPQPVISAVNGTAVGAGLAIVLASDIKISARSARYSTGFMRVGLAPGCGTWFMASHMHYSKAMDLLLTSRVIDAEEARDAGIVGEVVDDEALMDRALELAARFNELPPLALGRAKFLLQRAYSAQLKDQLALERRYISVSGGSEEFAEGSSAFREKRPPRFRPHDG